MFGFFKFFYNITNRQAIIIIFIMASFLSINSFIILNHNKFYSYLSEDVACIVDMSKSFITEYELVNNIQDYNWKDAINLLKTYWKPPAFFVFSVPLFLTIDNINLFLSVINFLFCFFTLFSIYGIVKKFHSINAGLFACSILSFCPLFFVMHRTFFIEILLMTSVSFILYIIVRNKFDNIYWNVLFTITLTVALLTKEQTFIYYPVFLLFIIINKENYKNIRRFVGIILSFLCSYICSYFLWYKYNAPNIFQHLLNFAKDSINDDYLYYLKSLCLFDFSPIVFVLFVISIIYFLSKKKHIHIVFSFVFILFIFSLSENRVSRHIFPLLIFAPILISLFIFQIRDVYIKKMIVFFVFFILFLQFVTINFLNFKYFINGNFYDYNFFKGVTYYDYTSKMQTYKQQYEYLKSILGENFERKTAFVQFFPPQAYNFLIFQQNRKSDICKIFLYDEIINMKENIINYDNVIISDRNENKFYNIEKILLEFSFEKKQEINIYNHDDNKVWLYTRKN